MFKYIVKNEGIAFDDERHYKGEKNTPMTILKVITQAKKVLYTQQ